MHREGGAEREREMQCLHQNRNMGHTIDSRIRKHSKSPGKNGQFTK
jgi:hypothetical protein